VVDTFMLDSLVLWPVLIKLGWTRGVLLHAPCFHGDRTIPSSTYLRFCRLHCLAPTPPGTKLGPRPYGPRPSRRATRPSGARGEFPGET